MTDHDQLLETVAVHIQWLRRPRPLLQSQADHLQSADYLEQLAAALRAALATRPQPLWHGATQFIGTRDNPVVGRSLVGFTLDVPPGTPVALYAAPAGSAGEILRRIHDTFDAVAAGPAAILQAILDEEGPEGVVDAVLAAAAGSATPTEEDT